MLRDRLTTKPGQGIYQANRKRRAGTDTAPGRQVSLVVDLKAVRVIESEVLQTFTDRRVKDLGNGRDRFNV